LAPRPSAETFRFPYPHFPKRREAVEIKVPLVDLKTEVGQLWDELQPAVEEVLRSGRFVSGPNVQAFERETAAYVGVRHAIGLNSGTDALVIGLRALGVGSGDEVITTPFTFVATAEAICRVGARPVFVDIDPRTFNLDPAEIERHVTAHTRALIPVHLFGHPADMDPILAIARDKRLGVLEDAAQAFGALYKGRKAGGLGDAAAFSFFPTKNLAAYGDGGMLVTDDDELAQTARKLRNHGSLDKYRPELLGYNSRLDELQAAILRVKFPHVDRWNEVRRSVASRYDESLSGMEGLVCPHEAPYARHVYHQYTVRVEGGRRDEVRERLASAGVASAIYYTEPLNRVERYGASAAEFVLAEQASREVLSLPVGPWLSDEAVEQVIQALHSALAR
jgi:dTDP-4-amino-4,6-dideoxygalactose transaminase